jgi:hypothetical protein
MSAQRTSGHQKSSHWRRRDDRTRVGRSGIGLTALAPQVTALEVKRIAPLSRLPRRLSCAVLAPMLVLLASGHAGAEPQVKAADPVEPCRAENLLARARLLGEAGQMPGVERLTDGVVAREGAPWPSDSAVLVLREPLTFDLGRVVALQQVYLQVDADQAFRLELSSNGRDWARLPVSASAKASGLSSRSFDLSFAEARLVRLVPTSEPATLVVTEMGVSCQRDVKLGRGLATDAPPRSPPGSSWLPGLLTALTGLPVISPTGASVLKLVVVALALGLLWIERHARRRHALAWGLLGAAAVAAYLNLGSYRYPEFVHDHDVFHYFVGAKYFPELGYDLLYTCSAAAEAEAGFEQRVRLRAQRDLRTNRIEPGSGVLSEAARCHSRFSVERWQEFRRDVAYFANGRSVDDWHRALKDHGFNASPTWIALARTLTRDLPASESTVGHHNAVFAGDVGPLDPLLLLLALAAICWGFGLRTAALVALVFACNPLSEFSWVGGGFLRQAWLSTLAIGISLLKKQRVFLGGIFVALSALLQLLPVVCIALPLSAGAVVAVARASGGPSAPSLGVAARARTAWNAWWSQRPLWRLAGGAALGVLVLVPLSAWATHGERAWGAFASNTAKHEATPSANLVGLGTLLSFRPSTDTDVLFDAGAADPFARVRAARLATRQRMRPIQGLGVLLVLGFLARGLRTSRELWWTSALGLCLVPFALETSCYYAAWLCVLSLVSHDRDRLKLPILGTLLALLMAKLTIARIEVEMVIASAILLLGVATVLVLGLRPEPAAAAPAAAHR